ncbi:hypothetical protein DMB95_09180 [Campylobacter sp. MIT 12-8780]|uniref:hypothetical protein n=1 Tax=unclassified Campylobacter TaxID=2593542 RepID=UPI00115E056C|nr:MULTISPECIES: hypothetical protein [unclassified Campylobacter]NDJ27239.1 hypothetical protein [Campylobacter sp. MIT 19-121]TQR40037.1 hypothetical protein DMB95_09180 [Campylobacter sp. MIT 12-8780]
MQVNYKTISSMEFDVLSGTYKKVDKQVEDESASLFSQLINNDAEQEQNDLSKLSTDISGFNTSDQSFNDSFNTALQSFRFRQSENEFLKTQSPVNQTQDEQKQNLTADLLSMLS